MGKYASAFVSSAWFIESGPSFLRVKCENTEAHLLPVREFVKMNYKDIDEKVESSFCNLEILYIVQKIHFWWKFSILKNRIRISLRILLRKIWQIFGFFMIFIREKSSYSPCFWKILVITQIGGDNENLQNHSKNEHFFVIF